MTECPFCDVDAPRGEVHAHMLAAHADRAEAWQDPRTGRMRHRIECPLCGEAYERTVKPRVRDARFLEEFAREIRLVGFDQLLNHIAVEHATSAENATAGGAPPQAARTEEPR